MVEGFEVAGTLLWGASDRIALPDYGKYFRDQIQGVQFKIVPDAGHFPQIEQPLFVVEQINSFVAML
ncbi:alpha/beta hydrolase [Chitinophaga qingshengii]|uniref:Alpha/beta hydrolase n=1 Tax=Chitinophaga qingshengii TaxID=1569794 RepID=A0ABR7TRB8_9BACT|nr:alpha/beta hydrolase [Chitinophaga qingshengii]